MTSLNFVSTQQFRKANPLTYAAVVAAFDEAVAWINVDKPRAAQFYLDASKEKISVRELTDILQAPDYVFGQTPHRIGAAIEMMHKAGILKTKPQSWKEMYFPEAHRLDGD